MKSAPVAGWSSEAAVALNLGPRRRRETRTKTLPTEDSQLEKKGFAFRDRDRGLKNFGKACVYHPDRSRRLWLPAELQAKAYPLEGVKCAQVGAKPTFNS